jgi:hypothetical protein
MTQINTQLPGNNWCTSLLPNQPTFAFVLPKPEKDNNVSHDKCQIMITAQEGVPRQFGRVVGDIFPSQSIYPSLT